jgi:hypothetical protein
MDTTGLLTARGKGLFQTKRSVRVQYPMDMHVASKTIVLGFKCCKGQRRQAGLTPA